MAKSVRKQKSRSQSRSLDERIHGLEPIEVSDKNYVAALNWYNYTYDNEHAKDFVLAYLKQQNASRSEISLVRRCPKDMFVPTIGWQAKMMMNGNKLSTNSLVFFKERLEYVKSLGRSVKEEAPVKDEPKPNIQERTHAKNRLIGGECDAEVIDKRASIYDFLVKNEVSPKAAVFLKSLYEPVYDEIMLDDDDIKEAYGKNLRKEREYWQTIIDDLDRYLGNKKASKVRKPRAKKVKAAIDVIKKLNYQKEDPSLKIVSVNPVEIIGAQQLWTFNTKYRKLTVFNAMGPSGFTIKGTTLIGFDDKTSIAKRLRKPEVTIAELLTAGKVTLRKLMDGLTTSQSVANGRINSDTVILRVIK